MRVAKAKFEHLVITYRAGVGEPSSDEQAIDEVLRRHSYRRVRDQFDVMPGETWLDLGANIGAFAFYCRLRGAKAVCFEPEPACFRLLERNTKGAGFRLFMQAVTASKETLLAFSKSKNPQNNYRGTVCQVDSYIPCEPVANFYAGDLEKVSAQRWGQKFDGIKMDIEGAEGPILDQWLLPRCTKLVLEYHHSRDKSVEALAKRLHSIRQHFKFVKVPKAYNDVVVKTAAWPRYDQLIFAWEPR